MPAFWEIAREDPALWVILFASVVALAVAIERAVALWGFRDRARTLADTVSRCLFRGAVAEGRAACERSRSPLADVFLVGFERLGRGTPNATRSAVDRERQRVTLDLKVRLWMLATIGATAPFIGLYGTVVGIMNAFQSISETGQGGFSVVAKGISAALIATAAGLIVALEAVVLYNYFNQRLLRLAIEIKLHADEFLELLLGEDGGGPRPAPEEPEGSRAGPGTAPGTEAAEGA